MTERKREQPIKVKTGKERKTVCFILAAVLLSISAILVMKMVMNDEEEWRYIPPAFESNAVIGTPEPDDSYLYGGTKTDYGFSFYMASNLFRQEDGSVKVYFTNSEENEVYLMLELVDSETGETLYRTGVIQPGEYIESVIPVNEHPNEYRSAVAKIYAFETENWYSEGTIEINCEIQPW